MQKSTGKSKFPKIIVILFLIVLLAGVCAVLLWRMSGKPKESVQAVVPPNPADFEIELRSPITLSETDYFYNTDIAVTVTLDKDAEIYYTLDGTTPDQSATPYTEPISFASTDEAKCYPLSIIAYYSDGTEPVTLNHTYFIGKEIDSRFDTYVFSITVDPASLWDYDYGIFTEGRIRDEYMAAHPGEEVYWGTPGNYSLRGRSSERAMYLEAFTPEGMCVISQDAGMRTYGGASRTNEQKSVKLYARSFYDMNNKDFTFPFFDDVVTPDGSVAISYTRLVIRNCGNDQSYAFIRDELIQRLAKAAGYQDTEAVKPCALFINGDYYGFYWLHENYGGTYFKNHYGDFEGEFVVLEGGETYKSKSDAIDAERDQDDELQDAAVDEYAELYDTYSKANLYDEEIYAELCSKIDIENYLKYYALNLYFDNTDWPMNNYKAYRYYASDIEGDGYVEGTAFDGKWRYLPHDMDYTLGIYDATFKHSEFNNIMKTAGTLKCPAPLFTALMQRTDCRDLFLRQMLDLANGFASGKTISETLTAMDEERANEQSYSYTSGLLADWVSPDQLGGHVTKIRNYAYARASYVLELLGTYYNFGLYTLNVTAPEDCQVMVNSYPASNEFSGSYYRQVTTTITPSPSNHGKFGHWLINGVEYDEEELVLTGDLIAEDVVNVELVLK